MRWVRHLAQGHDAVPQTGLVEKTKGESVTLCLACGGFAGNERISWQLNQPDKTTINEGAQQPGHKLEEGLLTVLNGDSSEEKILEKHAI